MTSQPPERAEPGRPPICDYEGSTYRTDFWEGRGREYEDGAERVALRRLLPPTGRRVLDVGAGFGRLADLYEGYDEVVLLDYSLSQLRYARRRLGDGRYVFVAADIYRLPLVDAAVDTTVMVRVLHHLAEVPRALAQLRRATRGGGTFVLEFANKRHLKNVLRHTLGRGPDPRDPAPHQFAELHYDYHPAWVLQRLREAGYMPGRQLAVSTFRLPLLKRVAPTGLLVALDAALQPLLGPLAPSPSQFVRCRAEGAAQELPPREALFRCPDCSHAPLERAGEGVRCTRCDTAWPIVDGVYVFK